MLSLAFASRTLPFQLLILRVSRSLLPPVAPLSCGCCIKRGAVAVNRESYPMMNNAGKGKNRGYDLYLFWNVHLMVILSARIIVDDRPVGGV